jgi:hypothetical protein
MTIDMFESRDSAIMRSRVGAGEEWVGRAVAAIEAVARRGAPFTTDEVWDELGRGGVRDPRAIGAAMREAVGRGVVRACVCDCCGQQVTRPGGARSHGRRMALWVAA